MRGPGIGKSVISSAVLVVEAVNEGQWIGTVDARMRSG